MVIPEKKRAEKSREYAYRVLEYNIVSLKMRPGMALSEGDLANQLGISRTPVREAMIDLARLKLVEILPQRGSYVTKIDYPLIEEIFFMRTALEKSVLEQACKGIDGSYIRSLEESIVYQRSCISDGDRENFIKSDNTFHELLFYSVGRHETFRLLHEQMLQFDRLRTLYMETEIASWEDSVRDHEDIVYALKRHDADMAIMLISRHMKRYLENKPRLIGAYPDYFTAASFG